MRLRIVAALLLLASLASCAAPYRSGFYGSNDRELEPGVWRVTMKGNGFTTQETIQTYWLYRCAELALEKDYDGIEILSRVSLTERPEAKEIQVAASGPVYIPMYMPSGSPPPSLAGDIRLLKKPFEPVAGRIFNAAALKAALEPFVNGEKCSDGNICPHVHHYLYNPL